ncbi:MAG: ATP-binding protein [Desulfobacteraceae bacterium]
MIHRTLTSTLKHLTTQYPVVTVTGPRQSGKTTLVRAAFPEWRYVSLEEPDMRDYATGDPRGFITDYPAGTILDEAQRAPDLFSYIQTHVDTLDKEGVYVLTGSFNFGLMEGISQSLAGRAAILELLPFSLSELDRSNRVPDSIEALMFTGGYPRIYDKQLDPQRWYADYVTTYLERDVRQVKNVTDLALFQRFLKMCAARSGQILNLSSLGDDCGITHNTARSWLSILEAGYIVYLLKPHHKNFNKRLIKSPKLYFCDAGLLSYLLGIGSPQGLAIHASRGHVFETWVIAELLKSRLNIGLKDNLYFWRDNSGHEIDCIVDKGDTLIPVEIKSGKTITPDYFKGLKFWSRISGAEGRHMVLVYAGEMEQNRKEGRVLSWKSLGRGDLF